MSSTMQPRIVLIVLPPRRSAIGNRRRPLSPDRRTALFSSSTVSFLLLFLAHLRSTANSFSFCLLSNSSILRLRTQVRVLVNHANAASSFCLRFFALFSFHFSFKLCRCFQERRARQLHHVCLVLFVFTSPSRRDRATRMI